MRGLAKLARDLGDGEIRLTVWQNLLISGVPDDTGEVAKTAIAAIGLATQATPIRAGLIACTGNTGCKFAASNTKDTAQAIAEWCEPRINLDTPINIHLTGCHHSCAQHYIGDIGLIACRVAVSDEGDTVEGFHLLVGGGHGPDAAMARDLYSDIKVEDVPSAVERLLKAYMANRASPDETFLTFTRRHDAGALKSMCESQVGA
jgi:ferredoxin-nitrite reductase